MASPTPSSILITGANIGLGKECARQLALLEHTSKVILACRSESKARAAKAELEKSTGKTCFEVLILDTSDLASVRAAVEQIKEPLDGLVLNAGGNGGVDPAAESATPGVPVIVASNLIGHVLLVDLLIKKNKLAEGASIVLSGSEAARGIPNYGIPAPQIETGSVEEFTKLVDGSFYPMLEIFKTDKVTAMYPYTKYMIALWVGYMARQHHNLRFVTMSPGGTAGTNAFMDFPVLKRIIFNTLTTVSVWLGVAHTVQVGAKRYVDALFDTDTYQSGVFYASADGVSGAVCDQSKFNDEFQNTSYQDNCNTAIHKFIQ